MGKTFSIKVLFGIYLLLMAGKVFAFSCNVDGGSSIGAGTTSVYVNLDPVILPGQNLVVDLSQHISCWNDYGGWYDTDHINLVQGSAFAGSLQSYKGSLYWNNVTYPFPLTTNTNVLDIGDKTPMPLPLKLYITPVGAAGGVVIKSGEVIARIHMYKIATLGSGNPRNFTWNIISNNSVVMPTGGCTILLDARMQHAKNLIRVEGSVNKIAEQCGYASTSYFIYAFRKHFGNSPKRVSKEYRCQRHTGMNTDNTMNALAS